MRRTRLVTWLAGGLGLMACDPTAPAPSEPEAATSPSALILLTVDTLRADHLGAYGSERGLSPNLDAWARDALVFDAMYAPTPFTVPSLVSLHTGRHPIELGLRTNISKVTDTVDTLAEVLSEHGWKTAAVVSNVVLQDRPDIGQGFEVYDDTMLHPEAIRHWMPERIAHETTDAAMHALDVWEKGGREAPLFLWVHYQDPHGPYTPPPGWRERYLAAERERYQGKRLTGTEPRGKGGIPRYQALEGENEVAFYHAGYAGEIAYFDEQIGRLLDDLSRRALDDHVVFAADHGEAMGENDYWFAHGNDLTDGLVRVPLFVRLPGAGRGRRDDVARLADLYPTLLNAALGSDAPALDDRDVRDLLAPGAEDEESAPLLATLEANPDPRLGIVADGFKLILTYRDGVWTPRLYRQGDEDVDLAAPAPHIAADLRERLWTLREQRHSDEEAPFLPMEEETIEQLEALGYVVDQEE